MQRLRMRWPTGARRDQRLGARCAAALLSLACAVAAANEPAPTAPTARMVPHGYAVPIGGALEYDNAEVWSRLVELSGGAGSRWVVLATAAGDPATSSARIIAALERHGALATHVPVAPRLAGVDLETELHNPRWLELLQGARGVYFSGGAQERIVDTLLPEGRPTALLEAIHAVLRRGGVVAGSSAGAAIMSATMFRDAGNVMAVMRGELRVGQEIDRGLGFAGSELFVDQHFLRRGRIGRMLPLMVAQGYRYGLGVDEDTAGILQGDEVEVIGRRGVLLVDLADARNEAVAGAFALRGARLSYLERGDRANLRSGEVMPAAAKRSQPAIEPESPEFKPFHGEAPFVLDILADGALVGAMIRVVDGASPETRGLAFEPRKDLPEPLAALGFEFRLYRAAATRGWYTGAFGSESYTLQNVYLDITPVRVATPLYGPWRP
jgi:cyanophycinase